MSIVTPTDHDGLRVTFAEAHRRYTGAINARFQWTGHLFQGRVGVVVMVEPHLLAATRYIALNPMAAGLVSRAEDWPWSSARAHLAREDDELAMMPPLRALIPDFAALLTAPADPATTARIERPHDRTAAWRAGMDRGARAAARLAPGTGQTGPKASNGRGHQAATAATVRTQVNCHRNSQSSAGH
jgi:putative transposase